MGDQKSYNVSTARRKKDEETLVTEFKDAFNTSPIFVGALILFIVCVIAIAIGPMLGFDGEILEKPRKPAARSLSSSAVTTTMTFGCFSRSSAHDMLGFRNSNDPGSFQAYIDSNKCVILGGGTPVTVTNDGSAVVGVFLTGVPEIKYWVPRQHLR